MIIAVSSSAGLKSQKGFSIPMAVFILVVVSMLGVAMINTLNRGQESVAREVVSLRALLAAESGAELGLNCVLEGSGCGCSNANAGFTAMTDLAPITFTGDGLASCTADVSCRAVEVDSIDYYTIRSNGRCGPASDGAFRIVEVQAHETLP